MALPPPSAASELLVHNERAKLVANALDRASTACFAGGVIGPWALWKLLTDTLPMELVPVALVTVLALWTAAGLALHHLGQRALGELR
jgi:hypothetical protein